jgi:phage-related minor tail protein
LTQRAKELSDPEAGFAKGLRAVAEEAEQIGKQMEAGTVRAFNGMTDALVGFVMTGKLDFRSLANSIISDLIRIQIQRAITLPLAKAMSSFFGFADGGVMTAQGPLPLRGYASGGIANSPQLAVFGEGSRPEAYVPLPDGRTIPVTMSGGAAGASLGSSTVFNISVNVSDAGASTRGDNAGGRDLGQAVANAVRQELLSQKRAGGLLDSRRAL